MGNNQDKMWIFYNQLIDVFHGKLKLFELHANLRVHAQ